MLNSIDIYLRNDDELTARKLVIKLGEDYGDLPDVSNSTIKRYGSSCLSLYTLFMAFIYFEGVERVLDGHAHVPITAN